MCLSIIGIKQPISEDSSEDESWDDNEESTRPYDEDGTYKVMKDVATINPDERYAEVSDLYNTFNSLSVINGYGRPKKYNIKKDQTFIVYDFTQDKQRLCVADILVLSMGKDNFTPNVIPGG